MKRTMQTLTRTALALVLGAGVAATALAADLKVGLSVSLSGPNSSLGVPYVKGMQAALAVQRVLAAVALRVRLVARSRS